MKPIHRTERASWVRFFPFVRVLLDSIPSFFSEPPSSESIPQIKLFFRDIYDGAPDETVVDSNLNEYAEQIFRVIDKEEFENASVLDIGCGSGALYQVLRDGGAALKRYLGIDVSHPNRILSKSAKIVNQSAYEIDDLELEPTHVLASNSFCYIESLERVYAIGSNGSAKSLVIVEPVPGIFWNRHFDGILLFYRSANDLSSQLQEHQWQLKRVTTFYLIHFRAIRIWPLCYAVHYVR